MGVELQLKLQECIIINGGNDFVLTKDFITTDFLSKVPYSGINLLH